MTAWPASISALPGSRVACGTVLFRHRGELRVTAIVKATFTLVPDGFATVAPPRELLLDDLHWSRSPGRSLQAASDLSPHRPRVDVTLVGHAYAVGKPVTAASARLAVFGERMLLDKTIHVYGDRAQPVAGVAQAQAALRPFDRMPLQYERAVASLDDPSAVENPLGASTPNLVDGRDPRRPAGFGPIARYWPGRQRLLSAADRAALDTPVPSLADAFDWGYFQTAPPDQQLEAVRGDEWLVLDGMHPTLARVQSRLPSAMGVARIYGRTAASAGEGEPLALVADTVAIDGDALWCIVVWRGSVPVPGGDAGVARLRLVAGLELPGRPLAWPRASELAGDAGRVHGVPAVTPFDGRAGIPASASPYAQATVEPRSNPGTGTMGVASDWQAQALAARAALPFDRAAGAGAQGRAAWSAPAPGSPGLSAGAGREGAPEAMGTMLDLLSPSAAGSAQGPGRIAAIPAPFPIAGPGSARPSSPEIAGAPWAATPAARAPELAALEFGTMSLDESAPAREAVQPFAWERSYAPPLAAPAPPIATPAPPLATPAAMSSSADARPTQGRFGLRETVYARLRAKESLHDLELEGAELYDLDFRGASLSGLGLSRANLHGANLSGVTATGLQLEGANLGDANLEGADLTGANLALAAVGGARFDKAKLRGADLQRAVGADASFRGASLEGADLRLARLSGGVFDDARLRDARAPRADLSGGSFVGADLSGASLRGCDLRKANLRRAKLDGADFRDAALAGANVHGASRKTAVISPEQEKTLVDLDALLSPGKG